MKKHLAKMLRRAAQKLDPQQSSIVMLTPHNYSATASNVTGNWEWREVPFSPEKAGRRAVRKHGKALRRLAR